MLGSPDSVVFNGGTQSHAGVSSTQKVFCTEAFDFTLGIFTLVFLVLERKSSEIILEEGGVDKT